MQNTKCSASLARVMNSLETLSDCLPVCLSLAGRKLSEDEERKKEGKESGRNVLSCCWKKQKPSEKRKGKKSLLAGVPA
jgi:hypothetical protein